MPCATALTVSSISVAVLLEASWERVARLRTSSATTANPFPASPALAASTAAFSARIFVWKAMSSIALITLWISWDFSSIARMASSI